MILEPRTPVGSPGSHPAASTTHKRVAPRPKAAAWEIGLQEAQPNDRARSPIRPPVLPRDGPDQRPEDGPKYQVDCQSLQE